MVFLNRVQQQFQDRSPGDNIARPREFGDDGAPLVSTLQKPGFSPQEHAAIGVRVPINNTYYSPRFCVFVESYFNTLHYIHPILDKEQFLLGCSDIWSGNAERKSRSFFGFVLQRSVTGCFDSNMK
jgi:hypothetical protein